MSQIFLMIAVMLFAGSACAEETYRVTSNAGTYQLQLTPHDSEIIIGELHHWHLLLKDADGKAIEGATVVVDGGMPAHGHGLPTAPKVIDAGEAGNYLIDGLRFNMPGNWELRLMIEGTAGNDTATLEFGL